MEFEQVVVWYVQGMSGPEDRWLTKIDAEKAARLRFPDENPDTRYARIWFKTYFREV